MFPSVACAAGGNEKGVRVDGEIISKTEDMRIRAWLKNGRGVRVEQYGLWRLSILEAVTFLANNYNVTVTEEEVTRAARRKRFNSPRKEKVK